MRASRRSILSGIVLLAISSVLAACGSADDTPPSKASPFEELLGAIPDRPDTRKSVFINDYAAVREIFGVPLPGPEADQAALQEYFVGVRGQAYLADGPFITGMHREAMENPRRQYLAFDGRNVDQSVEAGIIPAILEVALGRFDPDATAQALEACAECPPPDMESHNDVPFYSWGNDHQGDIESRSRPPAFDVLGRGGRIAVSGEYVYRTVETPGMKALIDSRSGHGQTLADVAEFRLLGRAMSDLGVYSAVFGSMTDEAGATPGDTPTSTPMPGIENRSLAEIENLSLLIPYRRPPSEWDEMVPVRTWP